MSEQHRDKGLGCGSTLAAAICIAGAIAIWLLDHFGLPWPGEDTEAVNAAAAAGSQVVHVGPPLWPLLVLMLAGLGCLTLAAWAFAPAWLSGIPAIDRIRASHEAREAREAEQREMERIIKRFRSIRITLKGYGPADMADVLLAHWPFLRGCQTMRRFVDLYGGKFDPKKQKHEYPDITRFFVELNNEGFFRITHSSMDLADCDMTPQDLGDRVHAMLKANPDIFSLDANRKG